MNERVLQSAAILYTIVLREVRRAPLDGVTTVQLAEFEAALLEGNASLAIWVHRSGDDILLSAAPLPAGLQNPLGSRSWLLAKTNIADVAAQLQQLCVLDQVPRAPASEAH